MYIYIAISANIEQLFSQLISRVACINKPKVGYSFH